MQKAKSVSTVEGKTVKGFLLQKCIGRGSFGEVYLGYKVNDTVKRPIAIKKINRAQLTAKGSSKEFVDNEIQIMS